MSILTHFGHCVKVHTYWSCSSGEVYTYTYDPVGNRMAMTSTTGVQYEYDDANCLTNVDGVAYTWDDNGNPSTMLRARPDPRRGVHTYTWDAASRLVEVESPTSTVS